MTLPTVFELRYAIADSLKLYEWMYYDKSILCLDRKRRRFKEFMAVRNNKAKNVQFDAVHHGYASPLLTTGSTLASVSTKGGDRR